MILAASGVLLSLSFAAPLCGTGYPAHPIIRTSLSCQPGWSVPFYQSYYCEDEGWANGGCAAPFQQTTACTPAPMTNPISYRIYHPATVSGNCTCELQEVVTPDNQEKGINGGQCLTPQTPTTP